MHRRLAVPLVVLAAVVATAAPAHAADSWTIPDDASIVIEGHGFGHGRGMSQYGALHAAEDGTGYRQIVEFYYPGTRWAKATGQVRIWITKGDLDNAVQVHPRSSLVARKVGGGTAWDLTKAKPRAELWRILPQGDATSILQYRRSGWHQYRKVSGLLEFAAKGKPITLDRSDGSATYRGILRSVPSTPGNRLAVNVLPMDSYLRGVVAKESPSYWPQQALRAQAIAARSYAAYHRAHRTAKVYDLDDGESFQVYGGAGAEVSTTDEAVAETAGKILTYGGEPAFTEFSSSNGGWTVAGDAPYLQAREDLWDQTEKWQVTFTDDELEAAWPSVGNLTQVAITGRDGNGEWGGRAGTVTLTGSAGSVAVNATTFRVKLGLRSTWLTLHVS